MYLAYQTDVLKFNMMTYGNGTNLIIFNILSLIVVDKKIFAKQWAPLSKGLKGRIHNIFVPATIFDNAGL